MIVLSLSSVMVVDLAVIMAVFRKSWVKKRRSGKIWLKNKKDIVNFLVIYYLTRLYQIVTQAPYQNLSKTMKKEILGIITLYP